MTLEMSARRADGLGLARLRAAGARIAATCARRWFLDRDGEFWLRELGLPWTLAADRARVVEVIDETSDTRTLVLSPTRWPGHRAGQYVPVTVELDGARHTRCYSISSGGATAGARRIAITVRRQPGGRVSTALHALRRGAWLGLGAPAGDFVLPDAPRLLLVAGGSGVTPIRAMARDLPAGCDAVIVHVSRDASDAIFGAELAALATRRAGLRVHAHHSSRVGRLDASALARLVPDLSDRSVLVCGPPGLIELVERCARETGAPVHHERFAPPLIYARGANRATRAGARATNVGAGATNADAGATNDGAAATVTLLRSGTSVVAAGEGPLLVQLERAGQRPAHGCRIGICNTCRCRKRSGVVEDLTTGAVSDRPDEMIRLCTSRARSDLALEL